MLRFLLFLAPLAFVASLAAGVGRPAVVQPDTLFPPELTE